MPTYEYLCTMCADQFEVVQKFSDLPLRICNQCGARLQKLYRSPGIVFKGSGWHSKDYGR
jgi:putative FmdB family regulatory protein